MTPRQMIDAAKKPRTEQRKPRIRRARTGVPEPLDFDLTRKPRSTLLTVIEVAAAVRRSAQTVRMWGRQPDHPIKFRKVDGRSLTTVGAVLDYLDTPQQCSGTAKRTISAHQIANELESIK
jgi:hypothetical protein